VSERLNQFLGLIKTLVIMQPTQEQKEAATASNQTNRFWSYLGYSGWKNTNWLSWFWTFFTGLGIEITLWVGFYGLFCLWWFFTGKS
jgi:hypothetical protein